MVKSVFIEGADGTGKSTQIGLLKKLFEERKVKVLFLREPGGSGYYEALREFYLQSKHEHPPISDALLSAAGRAANIIETKQALASGKWVVTDRAYPSSYVYQSVQGVPLADIRAINAFALGEFDYDIKILLDVSVEVAEQRINQSGAEKDHWESQGKRFFEKIRQTYLDIAKSENCHIIDASGDAASIHQQIIALIDL
ncbi:MAG: dTMP kinase [Candidatus Saccharimonadales bacterium]